jgi:hypothetical protein
MSRAKFKPLCGLYYGLKSDMNRLNMKNNNSRKKSSFSQENFSLV